MNPFQFCTEWNQVELTGLRALTLRELVEHLKRVPGASVYHHTHHFLKQHQSLSPEPPNDFAYWVTHVLAAEPLGEKLAAIDTVKYASIRALRERLVGVIEIYLAKGGADRRVPDGEAFHFMKSRSFVVPTPFLVHDLREFADALSKVSASSLYHHMFESRLRLERSTNDFSNWLETELGEKALARAIARMDPYSQTLEMLRSRILTLIESRHGA